ncbi:hypothetical protein [Glycomyces xiaoerkulensis]|uniref:hypothetical protein n=1 Tax=Glycomyces xiaoerkulensis TaxID=2038139 RepID=UPI000C25CB92|nr:hypothetical protein [Glycomyces xiaoerkulensis]
MADGYVGEFRRGPAIFSVRRSAREPREYRVDCNDGNGPSEVCRLPETTGAGPLWHGAWNGDQWCAWIESEARKVIENPP